MHNCAQDIFEHIVFAYCFGYLGDVVNDKVANYSKFISSASLLRRT